MQIKGTAIIGEGARGTKETLTFAQSCRAAEPKTTKLLIFAPVDYLETSKAGIRTITGKVKRTFSNSINPASWV